MLWEVLVLVMKTLDYFEGKFYNERTYRINRLERENKKIKNQLTENSKTIQNLENSLNELKQGMCRNGKPSFVPLLGINKPTSLSILKYKYPFLYDRVCVITHNEWCFGVGGNPSDKCPSDRHKLLIEGEEKIHFKNVATGEISIDYNIFYAGESNGNPLVALRRCSDNTFCTLSNKYAGTFEWKDNIEGYNDLWTLKRIEYNLYY